MGVKEFLNNVRLQWNEIEILRDRIDALDASILPNAIAYGQCKVQTSHSNVAEDKLMTLIEYKRELSRTAVRLTEDHRRAQGLINTLGDTRERQALEVYFLSIPPKSMSETAQEIGYSTEHTYRLCRSGVIALERREAARDRGQQDIAV